MISHLLGKRTLKSGEVHVFGGKPGSKISGVPGSRVGYVSARNFSRNCMHGKKLSSYILMQDLFEVFAPTMLSPNSFSLYIY